MRVFLDANVLFSAAYLDRSEPEALFRLSRAGLCELIASPYTIEEARRNLSRKRPQRLPLLEQLLSSLTVCAEPSRDDIEWALAQGLGLKDAPVLGAAVQAGADVLVTGDRTDFGRLYGRSLRGVEILTPAAALDRVLSATGA
jgi:predicted nucleic acid-binding protein